MAAAKHIPLDDRFWSKVEMVPFSECWYWTAALHSAGYGVFNVAGEILYAHRLAFAEAYGLTYDETEHVHHKCKVRPCCNPYHLAGLTASEHSCHHAEERSDFCAKGHSMVDAYIRKNGARMCRTCRRVAVVKNYTVGSRARGRSRLDAQSLVLSPSDASTGDVAPHSGIPGGEMSETKADLGDRGYWPEHCEQRAFVDGAKWWQFHKNGSTAFPSERDEMEAEAVRRFGEPARG